MVVYILLQEWGNPDEPSETKLLGAYDSQEKAEKALAEAYDDDCDWLEDKEESSEWEENNLTGNFSEVRWDNYYSVNWIESLNIQ
jgi:hypothetical protein